jgi:hypothetical protein
MLTCKAALCTCNVEVFIKVGLMGKVNEKRSSRWTLAYGTQLHIISLNFFSEWGRFSYWCWRWSSSSWQCWQHQRMLVVSLYKNFFVVAVVYAWFSVVKCDVVDVLLGQRTAGILSAVGTLGPVRVPMFWKLERWTLSMLQSAWIELIAFTVEFECPLLFKNDNKNYRRWRGIGGWGGGNNGNVI